MFEQFRGIVRDPIFIESRRGNPLRLSIHKYFFPKEDKFVCYACPEHTIGIFALKYSKFVRFGNAVII